MEMSILLDIRDELRVLDGRLINHLLRWAVGLDTPRAPRMDERELLELVSERRRECRDRILHVHDAERILRTIRSLRARVEIFGERRQADPRCRECVHVAELEVGEGGFGLTAQELAVRDDAVRSTEGVSLV